MKELLWIAESSASARATAGALKSSQWTLDVSVNLTNGLNRKNVGRIVAQNAQLPRCGGREDMGGDCKSRENYAFQLSLERNVGEKFIGARIRSKRRWISGTLSGSSDTEEATIECNAVILHTLDLAQNGPHVLNFSVVFDNEYFFFLVNNTVQDVCFVPESSTLISTLAPWTLMTSRGLYQSTEATLVSLLVRTGIHLLADTQVCDSDEFSVEVFSSPTVVTPDTVSSATKIDACKVESEFSTTLVFGNTGHKNATLRGIV